MLTLWQIFEDLFTQKRDKYFLTTCQTWFSVSFCRLFCETKSPLHNLNILKSWQRWTWKISLYSLSVPLKQHLYRRVRGKTGWKSTCDELPSLIIATKTKACFGYCHGSVEESGLSIFFLVPRTDSISHEILTSLSLSQLCLLLSHRAKRLICEEKKS